MKKLPILLSLSLSTAVFFTSCKKTEDTQSNSEIETTFELSGRQATSDNINEDDNLILNEAAEEKGLQGNFAPQTEPSNIIFGCATVTVSQGGFPKTILIDFGAGCLSNGIFRKGKINVVLSDSLRHTGSTSVMTFDNYFVNGFKREGTITWKNLSTATVKSWQRTVENGKFTAPDGKFWVHNGTATVTQTVGWGTINPLDDEFTITGTSTITNSDNRTRTSTILTPLHKRRDCANIDAGTIRTDGPSHTATLDFGNGTCDRVATISIDGNPPRTILLWN